MPAPTSHEDQSAPTRGDLRHPRGGTGALDHGAARHQRHLGLHMLHWDQASGLLYISSSAKGPFDRLARRCAATRLAGSRARMSSAACTASNA